jgi:hypothetical protein
MALTGLQGKEALHGRTVDAQGAGKCLIERLFAGCRYDHGNAAGAEPRRDSKVAGQASEHWAVV